MRDSIEDILFERCEYHKNNTILDLFKKDSKRFDKFSLKLDPFLFDFSKHPMDDATKNMLVEWAKERELGEAIHRLFAGEKINQTENRAVMHMALRANEDDEYYVDGINVVKDVHKVLNQCYQFAETVRNGTYLGTTGKQIETIVNIGIGGSALGPKLLVNALSDYVDPSMEYHFISRMDNLHVRRILKKCDPETTLFIVVSKTFTTLETMSNANCAKNWLINRLGQDSVSKHFVAVSTNESAVNYFGIDRSRMFPFWDWVGGRFSVCSAVGLIAMIALGKTYFNEFLSGARSVDQSFKTESFENNVPIIMGLLSAWYAKFWNYSAQAVLSYDENLELFVPYLQQLEMESNGKGISQQGEIISHVTGLMIIGGLGNDGQHAYYQWLHQSPEVVPIDFLIPFKRQIGSQIEHNNLVANGLAQSEAFAVGRSYSEVCETLLFQNSDTESIAMLAPHKVFKGSIPNTVILYPKLTPELLGMLVATYEHKVFVVGHMLNIFSFDQWGVELGKELAKGMIQSLNCDDINTPYSTTNGLVSYIKKQQTQKE